MKGRLLYYDVISCVTIINNARRKFGMIIPLSGAGLPSKIDEARNSRVALKRKTQSEQFSSFGGILMLSAWGFAMVLASFLFLYIGYLVDEILGTAPNFMLGSFFLAIIICIMRLYQEAWKKRKDV